MVNPTLAGSLLARAITDAELTGEPIDACLSVAARAAGRVIGEEAAADRGPFTSDDDGGRAVLELLAHHGYAPLRERGEIALGKCPFHRLAEKHRSLACGINFDFLTGLLEGMGSADRLEARLVPDPVNCCVRNIPE